MNDFEKRARSEARYQPTEAEIIAAAKAICSDREGDSWYSITLDEQMDFRSEARAALLAARDARADQ